MLSFESAAAASRKASGAASCGVSSVASRLADTRVSRLRRPISGLEYFEEMISPCSVSRICPFTVPGGCARIAW